MAQNSKEDIPGFDPATGEWTNLAPPSLPLNDKSRREIRFDEPDDYEVKVSPHATWWTRYDDTIISFGNSLATFIERSHEIFPKIVAVLAVAAAIIGFISEPPDIDFADMHWIEMIFFLAICGLGLWFIAAISYYCGIFLAWILFLPVALVRYICYNGSTLLLFLALTVSILISTAH